MKKFSVETVVGIFIFVGFFCFAYLSVRLGDIPLFGPDAYPVKARFGSVSGLKPGAMIEIAGVGVGKVSRIELEDYQAVVHMNIHSEIKIPDDTIASIRTEGIIGDKYIKIAPGGSDRYIMPGGEIRDTESALDLEEMVSKYIFGKI